MSRLLALLAVAFVCAVLGLTLAAVAPGHTSAPYCFSYGAHGQVGDATRCWWIRPHAITRAA